MENKNTSRVFIASYPGPVRAWVYTRLGCSCVSYTEQHSSIVDEHIKAAILPLDLLPGSLDALLTVHIQEEELWAQPLPLQLLNCLLTTLLVAG